MKKTRSGRINYGREIVLHASHKRAEAAAALLMKARIAAKAFVLDARSSVLTTAKARAAEGRKVLRRWASSNERVEEGFSTYFICGSCRRAVNPAANYCKRCGAFTGDAHAM